MSNLHSKWLAAYAICPRCREGAKTLEYAFYSFSVAKEVWKIIGLLDVINNPRHGWLNWLTEVFNTCLPF